MNENIDNTPLVPETGLNPGDLCRWNNDGTDNVGFVTGTGFIFDGIKHTKVSTADGQLLATLPSTLVHPR